MNYLALISDIDFSGFDAWWNSCSPSISTVPSLVKAAPSRNDDDHLSIAEWKFNVKSRIYALATADDVAAGWHLIDKNLKICRADMFQLFIPLFKAMLVDYNKISNLLGKSKHGIPLSNRQLNLGIISLLQLSYWYKKCSVYPNFSLKEKEVIEKLIGFMKAFNQNRTDLETNLEKLRNNIDDCVSELMFAGLASDSKTNISFNEENDFLVMEIPCEVKTVHDDIIIGRDVQGNAVPMSNKEDFGQLSLKTEMLEQILRNKFKKDIRDAIYQGGKIIFINASYSTVAHDLASLDFNNNVDGNEKFARLLDQSVMFVRSNSCLNYLPVIVHVDSPAYESDRFRWYHTSFSFKVPVMVEKGGKITLNESEYDAYNLEKSLTVDDSLFNKYPLGKNYNSSRT